MKASTLKCALVATVALGAGVSLAQEMGGEAEATAVNSVKVDHGEEVVAQVAMSPEVPKAAQEAVRMQQAAFAGEAPFVSASQMVTNTVVNKLKLKTGFDPSNRTVIVVATAKARYRNPSRDRDFIDKRNMKALEAYLMAKADIIRAINVDFEGLDRSITVSEDESSKSPIEQEFIAARVRLTEQQDKLADLLDAFDKEEAEALDNMQLTRRSLDQVAALDKKLSGPADATSLTAEQIAKRDAASKACSEFKKQLAALDDLAGKLPKKSDNEMKSDVKVTADMPLLGATVVTQSESWDKTTKEYQMSLAVVWSAKLQQRAERCLSGDFSPDGKVDPKKGTIQDWMTKQKLDAMVGPRRFVDKDGRNLFIGIAAASLDIPIAKQKGAKRFADVVAFNFVACSLLSDVKAFTHAKSHMSEYSDEFTEEESQKFAKSLYDEIVQTTGGNLQGCVPLSQFAVEYTHPISRKPIYVVPYYLDPDLSKDAKKLMEDSYAAMGRATKAMQRRQGMHEGQRQALRQVRESKEEFNAGVKEGFLGVQGKVNPPKPAGARHSVVPQVQGSKPKKPAAGGSVGGVHSGDVDIDTDF